MAARPSVHHYRQARLDQPIVPAAPGDVWVSPDLSEDATALVLKQAELSTENGDTM